MVHHALYDAVDRVQEVGVLAHGQHSVDLGVQQVVAEEETYIQTPFVKSVEIGLYIYVHEHGLIACAVALTKVDLYLLSQRKYFVIVATGGYTYEVTIIMFTCVSHLKQTQCRLVSTLSQVFTSGESCHRAKQLAPKERNKPMEKKANSPRA